MYAFLFIYIDNIVKIYLKKGLLHWYTYIHTHIYIYIYSDNTFYIDVGNESRSIKIIKTYSFQELLLFLWSLFLWILWSLLDVLYICVCVDYFFLHEINWMTGLCWVVCARVAYVLLDLRIWRWLLWSFLWEYLDGSLKRFLVSSNSFFLGFFSPLNGYSDIHCRISICVLSVLVGVLGDT